MHTTSIASNFVGLSGGLLMSVIAFSIVFLVVLGLMIMMMILKAAVGGRSTPPSSGSGSAPAGKQPGAAPQAPAAAQSVSQAVAASDDSELIAVITAAISASLGVHPQAVRIASFRPAATLAATNASAWRMAGIMQNSIGLGD